MEGTALLELAFSGCGTEGGLSLAMLLDFSNLGADGRAVCRVPA